jgi:hypothetical protein
MNASSPDRRLVLLIGDDDLIVGSLRHYLVTQGRDVDVVLEPPAHDAMMRAKDYDEVVNLSESVSASRDGARPSPSTSLQGSI